METIDDIMDKHAQAMSGGQQQTPQEPVSGVENVPVEPVTPEPASPAEPATTPEGNAGDQPATPSITEPSVDYNKFLEESSGGLFKTVDDFKASLDKVKGYEELQAKVSELENRNPFANDYVSKLNKLYAEGKTEDQIGAFNKLTKLGDISKIDPLEVKIQRLIFDGYPRATAERQVKNQFGLNISLDEDELTPEELAENKIKLEDAEVALRISAKEDADYLQSQLAQLEISDSEKQSRILAEAASKEAYEKKLTPFVNQLASSYEKGVSVPLKIGEKEIEYKFDFDENFRMDVAKMAKDYFMDNPVTEESVRSFKDYANTQYIAQKLTTEILPNAIKHGHSLGYKEATDEFQNKSGLPTGASAPAVPNSKEALLEAQRKVAFGED